MVEKNTQPRDLTTLRKKPFENIVGKGENAGNQHFLLLPQCFSILSRREIIILAIHVFDFSVCKCSGTSLYRVVKLQQFFL